MKYFAQLLKGLRLWKDDTKQLKLSSQYRAVFEEYHLEEYEFDLDTENAYQSREKEIIWEAKRELQCAHNSGDKNVKRDLLETGGNLVIGFPLIASSFFKHEDHIKLGVDFVRQPPLILIDSIDKLKKNGEKNDFSAHMYCILVSLLLCQGEISMEDFFTESTEIFKEFYGKASKLELEDVKDIATDLTPFYLTNDDSTFRFSYENIKDAVMISYAKVRPMNVRDKCEICDVLTYHRPRKYKPLNGEVVFPSNFSQDVLFAKAINDALFRNETSRRKVMNVLVKNMERYDDYELLRYIEERLDRYELFQHKVRLNFFEQMSIFKGKISKPSI